MTHYHAMMREGSESTASEPVASPAEARDRLTDMIRDRVVAERAGGVEAYAWESDLVPGMWILEGSHDKRPVSLTFEVVSCRAQHLAPPVTVRAEVWALSADEAGIWLVSGARPWLSGDILASQDEFAVVEGILAEHNARGAASIIHSTSWRSVDTYAVHVWVAALSCPDVLDHWPGALPVSPRLPAEVGAPFTHAADGAPAPRDIDVLHHAIRHLAFLSRHSATERAAMSQHWRTHLREWEPALAGLYSARHVPEIIAETG